MLLAALLIAAAAFCVSCRNTPALTEAEAQIAADLHIDRALASELKSATGSGFSRCAISTDEYDDDGAYVGERVFDDGISFQIAPAQFESIIKRKRERCAGRGYLLFRSEMNFGIGGKKDVLTLIPGYDTLEIVRLMRTDGINYGLEKRDIIAKLTEWNDRYPFYVVGAGLDWIDARFSEPPADMDSFAEEVAAFCPDVVEQGTDTGEELANEMRRTKSLFLWWD